VKCRLIVASREGIANLPQGRLSIGMSISIDLEGWRGPFVTHAAGHGTGRASVVAHLWPFLRGRASRRSGLKRWVASRQRTAEQRGNQELAGGFECGSTPAADVGAGVLSRFVDGFGVGTSSFGFEDRNAASAGIASSVGTGRGGRGVSRTVQEGWPQ